MTWTPALFNLIFRSVILTASLISTFALAQTANPEATPASENAATGITVEGLDSTSDEPVPVIKREREVYTTRGGTRYIEHPQAKKGLIKIDKNQNYFYKVQTSDQTRAGSFKVLFYEPSDLQSADSAAVGFSEVYGDSSIPMLAYEYERQFAQKVLKLGWTFGAGFYYAKGNGVFENGQNLQPLEEFTFVAFPLSLGLVARLDIFDRQPFVPYIGGGVGGFLFLEYRDDDQNPSTGAALGGAPAAHAYAGIAAQLGSGARSFLDLDREYGINKIFLTAEYRQYFALSSKYDFGGDAMNVGFTAEY